MSHLDSNKKTAYSASVLKSFFDLFLNSSISKSNHLLQLNLDFDFQKSKKFNCIIKI